MSYPVRDQNIKSTCKARLKGLLHKNTSWNVPKIKTIYSCVYEANGFGLGREIISKTELFDKDNEYSKVIHKK